jgi:Tfp pilus assembly protein FimT
MTRPSYKLYGRGNERFNRPLRLEVGLVGPVSAKRLRWTGERGMTQFELLVVLMIVVILGMIAIPEMIQAAEDYRLTAVAGQVSGVMGHARIQSVTGNTDFRVNVATTSTYLIQEDVSGTWTTRDSYELPDGFLFSASGSIVVFQPRGNATPATTLTIVNPNGVTRYIKVSLSGRSYATTTP